MAALFGYIIIEFRCMIHNEILILNFFSLNYILKERSETKNWRSVIGQIEAIDINQILFDDHDHELK